MDNSTQLLIEAIVSIGGIMAVTQYLFRQLLSDKWLPLASLALGLAIGQLLFLGVEGVIFGLIITFSGNAVYDNLVAFKKK